jgi:hypothetical protein
MIIPKTASSLIIKYLPQISRICNQSNCHRQCGAQNKSYLFFLFIMTGRETQEYLTDLLARDGKDESSSMLALSHSVRSQARGRQPALFVLVLEPGRNWDSHSLPRTLASQYHIQSLPHTTPLLVVDIDAGSQYAPNKESSLWRRTSGHMSWSVLASDFKDACRQICFLAHRMLARTLCPIIG